MLETGFDGLITAILTLRRDVGAADRARRAAGPDVPVRLPRAGGPGVVVPHPVVEDVPEGARERRPGDRPVRRDHDGHQGRAGLPPRAAQPADLRTTSPISTRTSTSGPSSCSRCSCRASGWSATSPPACVLLYGGYRVLHGEMTLGTLTAFLLYLRIFFEPMQEISQFFNTFQSAAAALEKIAGVLAEQPGIQDPPHPVAAAEGQGRHRFSRCDLLVRAGPAGAARPEPARSRRARRSPWSAPPARARPPSPS